MDIKCEKYLVFLFVLFYFLPINAQVVQDQKSNLWNWIKSVDSNEDKSWFAVRKLYEQNKIDSLFIINTEKSSNKIVRKDIKTLKFYGKNGVLLLGKNQLEILDLKLNKSMYLNHVKAIEVLEDKALIIYHFQNNTLLIHNFKGEKVNELNQVVDFFISPNQKSIFFDRNEVVEILDVEKNKIVNLFSKKHKVKHVIWNGNFDKLLFISQDENQNEYLSELLISTNRFKLIEKKLDLIHTIIYFLPDNEDYIVHGFLREVNNLTQADSSLDIWSTADDLLGDKVNPKGKVISQTYLSKKGNFVNLENKNGEIIYINNPNYYIRLDDSKYKDYTHSNTPTDLYAVRNNQDILLASKVKDPFNSIFYSTFGTYLIYFKDEILHLYSFYDNRVIELNINNVKSNFYWSKDEKYVYFQDDFLFYKYDLLNKKLFSFGKQNEKRDYKVLNTIRLRGYLGNYSKISEPNIVELSNLLLINNKTNNQTSIGVLNEDFQFKNVLKTPNRIRNIIFNKDFNKILLTEENFNIPTQISLVNKKKIEILFKSNLENRNYSWGKQKIIQYKDKNRIGLKGILYYPQNFDENKMYPMVTSIYEVQYDKANLFLYPTYQNEIGFNIPLLLEKGYFVFLPDIVYDNKLGPGVSANNCVNLAFDQVLLEVKNIDRSKLALIGHSHGGYETNFILTQSNRFAVAISGAGNSDLVRSYFSYNYTFRGPFYWQFENGQYQMNVPFSENKKLYFNNSPILNVENVKTPVLLWTGMKDENIHWEQTREFFIGLLRNKKEAIALFYKNEAHTMKLKENRIDLTKRIIDWLDYHLKEKTDIDWISTFLKEKEA